MNWEVSAAPYLPIHRRRIRRRRIIFAIVALAIALPAYLYSRHVAAESMGTRVFDEVESSVAEAYYDPTYHGHVWQAVAAHYRPLIVGASDVTARYDALHEMLAVLGDSHTIAFSPLEVDRIDRRPDAGIAGALVSPIDDRQGVMAVSNRSPAQRAGLRRGDIVVASDPELGPPGSVKHYTLRDPVTGVVRHTSLRLAPA